jgi:diadenosine tetraphosphate (Ap4A) HIT family hydrolase
LTTDYGFVLFLYLKKYDGQMICPFCTLPPERIIDSNACGVVIRDGFPISPGHTLIIPNRHVGSFFELEGNERAELLKLLDRAKAVVDAELKPQGYNIGINDGPAAGQTVPHLHIHLIPRFTNDRSDPRGGVRWIIPEKADYWSHR